MFCFCFSWKPQIVSMKEALSNPKNPTEHSIWNCVVLSTSCAACFSIKGNCLTCLTWSHGLLILGPLLDHTAPISLLCLSVVTRSPDNDAQPAAELPGYDWCAAAPEPWSAQFPEGRHGRTNAKHNGPVPPDAVISGIDTDMIVISKKICIVCAEGFLPTRVHLHVAVPKWLNGAIWCSFKATVPCWT